MVWPSCFREALGQGRGCAWTGGAPGTAGAGRFCDPSAEFLLWQLGSDGVWEGIFCHLLSHTIQVNIPLRIVEGLPGPIGATVTGQGPKTRHP